MKTVVVSTRSKTLNELLKMAQGTDLILQSADGMQFLLARITDTQAFYIGKDDEDFDKEIAATRRNKRLMKFLDGRAARAKDRKGTSFEEVKRQLGV